MAREGSKTEDAPVEGLYEVRKKHANKWEQ